MFLEKEKSDWPCQRNTSNNQRQTIATILREKILDINIVNSECKKFFDKTNKKNKNCQRKSVILSFQKRSLPFMQDIEFFIDFLLEYLKIE